MPNVLSGQSEKKPVVEIMYLVNDLFRVREECIFSVSYFCWLLSIERDEYWKQHAKQ
jgi:hypothetical protein